MSHTQGAAPSGPRDPRIGEERHSASPCVDGEVDSAEDRGRRWYQLRPEPRLRTDFMGFNSRYWMALGWLVLLIAVAFPFPWWW